MAVAELEEVMADELQGIRRQAAEQEAAHGRAVFELATKRQRLAECQQAKAATAREMATAVAKLEDVKADLLQGGRRQAADRRRRSGAPSPCSPPSEASEAAASSSLST